MSLKLFSSWVYVVFVCFCLFFCIFVSAFCSLILSRLSLSVRFEQVKLLSRWCPVSVLHCTFMKPYVIISLTVAHLGSESEAENTFKAELRDCKIILMAAMTSTQ